MAWSGSKESMCFDGTLQSKYDRFTISIRLPNLQILLTRTLHVDHSKAVITEIR